MPASIIRDNVTPTAVELLWGWNETDLTQFLAPESFGGGDGTLSVAAYPASYESGGTKVIDASSRNRLVYSHDGTAPVNSGRVYWVDDLPILPGVYVVEATLGPRRRVPLGENTSPAVVIAGQDASHLFCFARGGYPSFDNDLNILVADGLPLSTSTIAKTIVDNIMDTAQEGYRVRLVMDVNDPTVSTDPGVSISVYHPYAGSSVIRANSSTWSPGLLPWDSGWRTGGTIKNIGLLFQHDALTPGEGYITDFRVLRLVAGGN